LMRRPTQLISTYEASNSTYEVSSQFMRSYLHHATCNSTDEASNVVFQRVRPPSQLMRSYLILCRLQRLMSIDEASNSTHATSNSIYEASNSTHLNVWGIQRLMSIDEASNVSFQRTRHPTQLMRRPTQLISTYEASNSTYEASNSTYEASNVLCQLMRHPMSHFNVWGIQLNLCSIRWDGSNIFTMSCVNLLRDRTCYEVWSQRMRHPTRLMRSYLNLCGMQCLMCDVYEAVDEATYTRHIKMSYVWRLWGSWRGIQLDYWGLISTCAVCNVFCVTLMTFMRQLTRHPTRLKRSYLNLCGMQCLLCDVNNVYEAVDAASILGDIGICIHIYVYRWESCRYGCECE